MDIIETLITNKNSRTQPKIFFQTTLTPKKCTGFLVSWTNSCAWKKNHKNFLHFGHNNSVRDILRLFQIFFHSSMQHKILYKTHMVPYEYHDVQGMVRFENRSFQPSPDDWQMYNLVLSKCTAVATRNDVKMVSSRQDDNEGLKRSSFEYSGPLACALERRACR